MIKVKSTFGSLKTFNSYSFFQGEFQIFKVRSLKFNILKFTALSLQNNSVVWKKVELPK